MDHTQTAAHWASFAGRGATDTGKGFGRAEVSQQGAVITNVSMLYGYYQVFSGVKNGPRVALWALLW
eukprot:1134179-Pelagomonas_calceolata.AAC.2